MSWFLEYNFLLLSLIFWLPGAIILLLRPDLRRPILLMALCSLPFALTESLFYPEYWRPRFLFDLVGVLGFGIEDLLFVTALGAFTPFAYSLFFRRRYRFCGAGRPSPFAIGRRLLFIIGGAFLLLIPIHLFRIPMIYGACAIMTGITLFEIARRRDLLLPGLWGGLLAGGVYTVLCLLFQLILPDIFRLAWNTEKFLNFFVLGVPLEEILYGFCSGLAATVFYPFVFELRFAGLPEEATGAVPEGDEAGT